MSTRIRSAFLPGSRDPISDSIPKARAPSIVAISRHLSGWDVGALAELRPVLPHAGVHVPEHVVVHVR